MNQAPVGYPISLAIEPLPTPPGIDANILGRNTMSHHPMQNYGFLGDKWDCDHPSEWVKMKTTRMAKFVGKQRKTIKGPWPLRVFAR